MPTSLISLPFWNAGLFPIDVNRTSLHHFKIAVQTRAHRGMPETAELVVGRCPICSVNMGVCKVHSHHAVTPHDVCVCQCVCLCVRSQCWWFFCRFPKNTNFSQKMCKTVHARKGRYTTLVLLRDPHIHTHTHTVTERKESE